MAIIELKDFNLHEKIIEKQKIYRAYMSEINQRYNNMRNRKRNSL